ncbi:MAG: hypothetical protein EZS28_032342, partial [Streblomastix strix]
ICAKSGIDPSLAESGIVEEIVRAAGTELHTIASIVGGLASQESVKLLSHTFTPLKNTNVYNGLNCTTASGDI